MRWGFGLFIFMLALLPWLASMIINPYTSWGIDPEHLIYENAISSRFYAGVVALMFMTSALIIYCEEDNRHGRRGFSFAPVLLFFAGSAIARALWITFHVLA